MNYPKISVIMGVYNCENTVGKAVESIINQTYTNWEFIICDDGSTDRSYEIIKEYENRDGRIIALRNDKNLKLSATLNRCLKIARGTYIARMDADDIALKERFEKQVLFLEKNPDIAVVGTAATIFNGNQIVSIRYTKALPSLKDAIQGAPFIHPSIMMRKEAYVTLGGYTVAKRTERGQDRDLWLRFFSAGFQGANIQESYLIYHESNEDYKKRSLLAAARSSYNVMLACRKAHVKPYLYIYTLTPIISFFIPKSLKRLYRKLNGVEKKQSAL